MPSGEPRRRSGLRGIEMNLIRLASLGVAILFSLSAGAKRVPYSLDCDLGKGTAQTTQSNGFTVVVSPRDGRCYVSVLDTNRRPVFEYHAAGMQAFVGAGPTDDDQPSAVIQADTDDPYRLFIVSLGSRPGLVRSIENQYGFWLQDDCNGRIRLWTADGAFQQDPDLANVYHPELFAPEVVFELRGTNLIDATPDCKGYFDESVSFYRARLTKNDLQRFRTGRIRDGFYSGQVRGYILKIVFSYLYSGQETEAKHALAEMWPAKDRDRVWESILKERSTGVLTQVGSVPVK
jgi:hypothetical protein